MSTGFDRSGAPRAVVRTAAGAVRGSWEPLDPDAAESRRAAVFRGIPYAAAPIGALRFAAPKRVETWEGVREATAFGPTPQRGDTGITLIPEHSVPGDDTLNVNVWTPDPGTSARLPVVVWIHGGGFISGSPASPWYDGRAFARDGLVLVTISYRLGFTGFGWIDGAPANRGVLDWVSALEWVQQNISAFGGDPDRVTVAGQSAGGGAVLTLLGVPAARGLFRAGYAMSAAVAAPSIEPAAARTRHLARIAGVSPEITGISALSEARILELQRRITAPAAPRLLRDVHGMLRDGLMIGPLTDGDVVPSETLQGASRGVNAHVPLVMSTADDELMGMFTPRPILDRAPRRAVLRALGASAPEVDHWLATPEIRGTASSVALVGRYATDAVFRSWVPRITRARAASERAGDTWTSRFSWHAPESQAGAPHFAGHCSDVPFVFDRLDAPGVERVSGGAPPQELADAVHGALVRFARDGAPGWPRDEAGTGPTRVFDLPVRDEHDAYASAAALLKEEGADASTDA
ncbi:carboxylesterase family protein [Leucobacter sp. USCH14]|uniref:carboxylesterase/lipase family protein n=1 Tax=Leucobacter sp. USCH14 TaxID=3024838 RepID=UPI0030A74C89